MRNRRELSDDQIGAMGHAIGESDPDLEIGALFLRNTFARRKGKKEEEYKQRVIGEEITYGGDHYDKDGVKRMRLVRDNFYVRLQIGIRFKDKPEEFSVNRQLTLNQEELPLAIGLLNSLANKPQLER